MKLNKLYDCRNFGQLDDGYPFTVKIECTDEKGAEYKGWYYVDDNWADYKIDGNRTLGNYRWNIGRYYFHQSKLESGKPCCRKVSAKITKLILQLINDNISTVEDFSIAWNKIKSERSQSEGVN